MRRPEVPTTCPYCGQPLVKAEAINHLVRAQQQLDRERARWERSIRAEAEAEARRALEEQL